MGFSDKAVHGSDKWLVMCGVLRFKKIVCILNDSAKSIRDSKALCV